MLGLLCRLQQVAPKAVQARLRVVGRMGPCVEPSLGQAQALVLTSCELTLSPATAPHCRGAGKPRLAGRPRRRKQEFCEQPEISAIAAQPKWGNRRFLEPNHRWK